MADVPDMQMIPYLTATEPRNFVEQGLQRYNELLERLAGQMDDLLALAQDGQPIGRGTGRPVVQDAGGVAARATASASTGLASPAASMRKPSRSTCCCTWTGNCPEPSSSWSGSRTGTDRDYDAPPLW